MLQKIYPIIVLPYLFYSILSDYHCIFICKVPSVHATFWFRNFFVCIEFLSRKCVCHRKDQYHINEMHSDTISP